MPLTATAPALEVYRAPRVSRDQPDLPAFKVHRAQVDLLARRAP